ncbi:MAG: acetylxylan esterase, partial [Sphingobacteriales bacterium]
MGEIVNYDETTVPAYTLPDVLTSSKGQKIKNVTSWEKSRQPEILALFEENVYGVMPKKFDKIAFKVKNEIP